MGDVAGQAIAGPALEVAGVAIKATAPFRTLAGKIGTSILARDIGIAEPFIENVKRNPAALKNLSNDMSVVLDHAKSLGDIMKRGVDRLGDHVRMVEDQFISARLGNPGAMPKAPLKDIVQKLADIKFRASIAEDGTTSHILNEYGKPIKSGVIKSLSDVPQITGSDVEMIGKYNTLIKKFEGGANALDLIGMKRQLSEDIAWNKPEEAAKKIGSQTNGILKGLYKDIQSKLDTMSPELKEANAHYSKARGQYDVLQRKVFGGSPEEAYQRIRTRIMRGVAPQALIERAAQINSSSEKAMRAVIDKISAQQFSPYIRKGIAGGAIGVGAGAAAATAMGGHALYPLVADLGAAVLSSPRLAALGIRGADSASYAFSKLAAGVAGFGGAHELALRALGQAVANDHKKPEDRK
jgi:hypothetical protein